MNDSLPLRQIKYLKRLPEPVLIRDRDDSYAAKGGSKPLKEGRTWFEGKTISGRLIQDCELVWDIDCGHKEGIDPIELWGKLVGLYSKLKKFFDDNNISGYTFDSGRGLHIEVFTNNMVRKELDKKENQIFRKNVWKEINRQVGYSDEELMDIDESPMVHVGQSVIRVCGSYNENSKTYKTMITDLTKRFCNEPEQVIFPEQITLCKLPNDVIENAMRNYKDVTPRKKREMIAISPNYRNLLNSRARINNLELPCMKNLMTKSIPPTGRNIRGHLAMVVAYNGLMGTRGNEEKTKELLSVYSDNCRKLDPKFPGSSAIENSQWSWINHIMKVGLKDWRMGCNTVMKYEQMLKQSGHEIVICEKNKCKVYTTKRIAKLKRFL